MKDEYETPDQQAITQLDVEWGKAASAGNVEGVVSLYADDGSLVWPDTNVIHGIDGIRQAWTGMLAPPGVTMAFTPERIVVSESGDLATDFGVVTMQMPPTAPPMVAKYLVVWQKVNGAWKVLYDAWNTDAPATPPAGGGNGGG